MPRTKCGFIDTAQISGADLLVLNGPSLLVDIGFDAAFQANTSGHIPTASIKAVWALVDTGATESCIDSALATKLALPIIDRRSVSGVSGRKEVNMHLAQIFIPSLQFTLYGAFAGVDLTAGGQTHVALIGRTFLRRFTMIYNGTTGDVEIYS